MPLELNSYIPSLGMNGRADSGPMKTSANTNNTVNIRAKFIRDKRKKAQDRKIRITAIRETEMASHKYIICWIGQVYRVIASILEFQLENILVSFMCLSV